MFRKGDPAIIRSTGQQVVVEGPGAGRQLVCRFPRRFVKLVGMPEPGWGYGGSGCPMDGTIGEIITYRRPPRPEDAATRETVALWGNEHGTIWVHRRTTVDSYGTLDEDAAAGRVPIVFHLLKRNLVPCEMPDYLAWPEGVVYDEYGDEMDADDEHMGRPRYERVVVEEDDLQMAHPTVLKSIAGELDDPFERMRKKKSTEDFLEETLSRAQVAKVLESVSERDLNGHWRDSDDESLLEDLFGNRLSLFAKVTPETAALLTSGNPDGKWVNLGMTLGRTSGCPWCGKDDISVETNGKVLRIAGEPCKYAKGTPLFVDVEVNIPSGRMVVADDGNLRPWFPMLGYASGRGLDGTIAEMKLAENHGLAASRVGQCFPDLYRTGPGRYAVVLVPSDERWDSEKGELVAVDVPKPAGKKVARCGEFGYTICDGDEFDRRIARFGDDTPDVKVIRVPKGVYRFRRNLEARFSYDDEDGQVVTFTEIERVRGPDPVRDFLGEFDAAEYTAGQYVQAQVRMWPSLYGVELDFWQRIYRPWEEMSAEERAHSWRRVANHIFCVIGGGTSWHPKGFPLNIGARDLPDAPVPKFRAQHSWYPMSENYGGLCLAAGVGKNNIRPWEDPVGLAPSFARLAFEVCESMISFGVVPRDGNAGRSVSEARGIMKLALRCYRALAERYAEHADPEYLAWVRDGDRADRWVAVFDLGPKFMGRHRAHLVNQVWFPTDSYAVEFDARKLTDGHFAWHPQNPGVSGCWARKEDAQRFAIQQWKDNGQEGSDNNFWTAYAPNSIPLYVVARVSRMGSFSHMGETLIEVAFDYGTPWMRDPNVRKALVEHKWKAAIRPLSKEEYEALLPTAEAFFEEAEREIQAKRPADKNRS